MPDCEWLTSTVRLRRFASADRSGTVGFGVGSVALQSATICFQNSPCASSGYCMPGKTCGYDGPKRKIAHADSRPAEKTGGNVSTDARPSLTASIVDGSTADRPRAAW